MSQYVVDPAFQAIPKSSTAFIIWRIENMQVKLLPKEQYGNFYDGDSYIVYAASEQGKPSGMDAKSQETKNSMEIHIHFWLGEATSTDEMGVATIKTVELDTYLGGSPVQHRETQGNESDRFKAYFPTGLRIMKGGVATGFNVVTDHYEPRLFRVKGRKNPTVTQMSSVSWQHFNSGDIFILDTKDVVFVWVGKEANHAEKVQGARTAQKMKDEHDAGAVVFVDDGKEKDLHKGELEELEQFLKLSDRKVKTAEEAGDDGEAENKVRGTVKLYHCTDEDGTYKITEIKSGPLLQTDLNSQDSFIVDNGQAGIWVWVGKRASATERSEAMRNAHGFVNKKGYPESTRVTKVVDQGEPTEFKLLFSKWQDKNQVQGFGTTSSVGKVTTTVHTKFDATSLHDQPQLAADSQLVDDGSAKKEVWRMENFELKPIPEKMYGLFFSGDTYLIQYTYTSGTTEKYILYYWIGDHASIDERGAIAMRTVEKDNSLGGAAVQVRVIQGKEPAHFLAMFGGKMIIFHGGVASSFDGEQAKDTSIPPEFLLQVRGNLPQNTRAVEVDLEASSLNTNDVFVLKKAAGENYVWCGKGSSGDEREMAKSIAEFAFKTDFSVVQEGQEKEAFWKSLGGKQKYADNIVLASPGDRLPPRLFQCSNATGNFKAEEILNFVQTDLAPEDVMLLDARDAILIWIGIDSNETERKLVVETALEYLRSDPTKRDVDTPIIQVKQGNEPPNFTGFFGVWDDNLWKDCENFESVRAGMVEKNSYVVIDKESVFKGPVGFDEAPKFPIDQLIVENDLLPAGVDKGHKEHHLSHADFTQVFGLEHKAFVALPEWKQINLKKAAKLF